MLENNITQRNYFKETDFWYHELSLLQACKNK